MSQTKRMPMKKMFLITIAAITVLVLAGIAFSRFASTDITSAQAEQIAIEVTGGWLLTSLELEWQIWRWVWEAEVLGDGVIHEIYIDANTGRIISHERDILD
ncbi:MAG: hypothetical protein FWE34_03005 [Defluviitaleaceae bacterium]|nr:hypothetical protein [Defluviitaleaceae bacterium]